jgi:hypothetical protein
MSAGLPALNAAAPASAVLPLPASASPFVSLSHLQRETHRDRERLVYEALSY